MNLAGTLKLGVVLLVICTLLASLRIPHWLLELFTHFRLQYLWGGLVLIAVAVWLREFVSLGTLTLVTILNGWYVVAWFLPVNQPALADKTLRIFHANVYSGNTEHDALIELVRKADPDVIFLQEVTPKWKAGIAELTSDWPHTYFAERAGNFGIAALSKEPFLTIRHMDSPPQNHPTIVASIAAGQGNINLVSTHPTIPLGTTLAAARNTQIEWVAEMAGSLSGKTIVSGDFNATNWDWRLLDFEDTSGLTNARRGLGVMPTWPSWSGPFGIPIDHVFVSNGVRVVALEKLRLKGSDHLPLVVTLTL